MDLGGTISYADLSNLLDAMAGLTGATSPEDAFQFLFIALVRVVGVDMALCLWVDAVRAIGDVPVDSPSPAVPVPDLPLAGVAPHVAGPGAPSGRELDDARHVVARLLRPHLEEAFRRATRPVPVLTPREKEVLQLVRDGLGNAAIARVLGVAESTVVKHLEHVYARVGAHSRTQALRLCEPALD